MMDQENTPTLIITPYSTRLQRARGPFTIRQQCLMEVMVSSESGMFRDTAVRETPPAHDVVKGGGAGQ